MATLGTVKIRYVITAGGNLRHHERGTSGGDLDTLTSVGVLLTPRQDGYRDWETTIYGITGDPELDDDPGSTDRRVD